MLMIIYIVNSTDIRHDNAETPKVYNTDTHNIDKHTHTHTQSHSPLVFSILE